MRLLFLITGMIFLFTGAQPLWSAEAPVKEGDELSLEQCVDIAVKNQPSILQYTYASQANEASVGQAKSSYYPQLDLSANYTRYNAVKQFNDPITPISLYGYSYYGNNISLRQKIYDFGKREAMVDVARLNLSSSQAEIENQVLAVINNVKTAYYNVLRAKRSRDVNIEARQQYREQLKQASFFFEAGKKPKYDVTTAEVNLGGAELNLISAENDLDIAWVSLNNAMGLDGSKKYTIQESLAIEPYEMTEAEALARAMQNRADLKAMYAQQVAAQRSVDVSKKDYYPSVDASAGYDMAGSQTPLSQGWNAGVSLTWNVFKGFSTQKEIEKALANLKVVEAKIAVLKLSIRQEVKKALLDVKRAKETIASAEIQVKQATENMELANLRYRSGLGTPIEMTNATVSYSNAKLIQIGAAYSYITARANVERAMGNR